MEKSNAPTPEERKAEFDAEFDRVSEAYFKARDDFLRGLKEGAKFLPDEEWCK